MRSAGGGAKATQDVRAGGRAVLDRTLMAVTIASWLAVLLLLIGGSIRLPGLRITELSRTMAMAVVASAALLAASKGARAALRRWLASPSGVFSVITVFAAAMSLGPEIHAKGRVIADTGLYAAFYNFVPGFDGVRVPARF